MEHNCWHESRSRYTWFHRKFTETRAISLCGCKVFNYFKLISHREFKTTLAFNLHDIKKLTAWFSNCCFHKISLNRTEIWSNFLQIFSQTLQIFSFSLPSIWLNLLDYVALLFVTHWELMAKLSCWKLIVVFVGE